MTRDGSDAQPDAFTRHPSPPSLLPSDPHRQARIVDDGILHYGKAGYKVVEKTGDNGWDRVHKGRKRCTGRGERIMWTSLPLGFDEIAHDSGYGRE